MSHTPIDAKELRSDLLYLEDVIQKTPAVYKLKFYIDGRDSHIAKPVLEKLGFCLGEIDSFDRERRYKKDKIIVEIGTES
jgi:hypothetical protein